MELQQMIPGYLDVIFHNRNKAYGGYELRVNYPGRARNGALYAFLAVGIVLGLAVMMEQETTKRTVISYPPPGEIFLHDLDDHPKPPVIEMHHAAKPAPAQQVRTEMFTRPVIVADNTPDPKLLAPVTQTTSQPATVAGNGAEVSTGSVTGTGVTPGNGISTGTGIGIGDKPFKYVEQMPEFTGDLYQYLSQHVAYPEAARQDGIQGKVFVRFVVNEDGNISDAEVLKGIGGGCDQEALRVVRGMPKWKPGRQNGRTVKVYFTLPIVFMLQ